MNKTSGKYLSLTTILLAMNCSPSVQQTEVKTKPEVKVTAKQEYDCSSLDLTRKVGFSVSFTMAGKHLCYRIQKVVLPLQAERYLDSLAECDDYGKTPKDGLVFIREFMGPEKGRLQINYVLDAAGDYIPFWREPSGEINSPFEPIPEEVGKLFDLTPTMLDKTKNHPQICPGLLEYKPSF